MTRKSNMTLYITLGSILIILAALIVVMWRIGLFDFTGTDPSSKVVGAALALVGTLVVGAVTIVGAVLKQSYDQQAEQRLKLEASVRALQLFSTSEGKETLLYSVTGHYLR